MDGLKRRIRTTAEFFDELQDEIDAIKDHSLPLEEAREVSRFRGHQVKVATVASQNQRFALRTRKGEALGLLEEGKKESGKE